MKNKDIIYSVDFEALEKFIKEGEKVVRLNEIYISDDVNDYIHKEIGKLPVESNNNLSIFGGIPVIEDKMLMPNWFMLVYNKPEYNRIYYIRDGKLYELDFRKICGWEVNNEY